MPDPKKPDKPPVPDDVELPEEVERIDRDPDAQPFSGGTGNPPAPVPPSPPPSGPGVGEGG